MSKTPAVGTRRHPAVHDQEMRRAADVQLRLADVIMRFAGSMTFVMIGQNRQADIA
jgi:uncharacterized membrane protein